MKNKKIDIISLLILATLVSAIIAGAIVTIYNSYTKDTYDPSEELMEAAIDEVKEKLFEYGDKCLYTIEEWKQSGKPVKDPDDELVAFYKVEIAYQYGDSEVFYTFDVRIDYHIEDKQLVITRSDAYKRG